MKMQLLIGLFIMPFAASAVVIRSDIDGSKYRIDPSEFRALADMPGEGHGVLIAPKWIVTAAHAALWKAWIPKCPSTKIPTKFAG